MVSFVIDIASQAYRVAQNFRRNSTIEIRAALFLNFKSVDSSDATVSCTIMQRRRMLSVRGQHTHYHGSFLLYARLRTFPNLSALMIKAWSRQLRRCRFENPWQGSLAVGLTEINTVVYAWRREGGSSTVDGFNPVHDDFTTQFDPEPITIPNSRYLSKCIHVMCSNLSNKLRLNCLATGILIHFFHRPIPTCRWQYLPVKKVWSSEMVTTSLIQIISTAFQ